MSDVTLLLDAAAAGDRKAAAELLPLVYDELRKLAAAKMAAERPDHTLTATALVHEAYLRLVGKVDDARWENRGHFFASAAKAMRQILVDYARRRSAFKRCSGKLASVNLDRLSVCDPDEDVLAVDEALDQLAAIDPKIADLVQLRYFGGLSVPEAAKIVGVSPRTADNWWVYARAWLATHFSQNSEKSSN